MGRGKVVVQGLEKGDGSLCGEGMMGRGRGSRRGGAERPAFPGASCSLVFTGADSGGGGRCGPPLLFLLETGTSRGRT